MSQYLQRAHGGQLEEGSVSNDSQWVVAEDPEKQQSSVRADGEDVSCVCRARGDGLAAFKEALQEVSRAGERAFAAAHSWCSLADIHCQNQDFPQGKSAFAHRPGRDPAETRPGGPFVLVPLTAPGGSASHARPGKCRCGSV